MGYEEISLVIELLCKKFGIAIQSIQELFPYIVQYRMATSSACMIMSGVGFVLTIILFYITYKHLNKSSYNVDTDIFITGMIASISVMFVSIIVFLYNFYIYWIFTHAPEAACINYILSLVGNK